MKNQISNLKQMITITLAILSFGHIALAEKQVQVTQIESLENSQNISITSVEVAPLATEFFSYNFGSVMVNSLRTVRYTVTNTGETFMPFKESYISGGSSFGARHSCKAGLAPHAKCSFTIEFWPAFEGPHGGRFVLNMPPDQIIVDLWGQATRF